MSEKEKSIIAEYISNIDEPSKYYKNTNLLHKVISSQLVLIFIISIILKLINVSIMVVILVYLLYITYILIISNPFVRIYLLFKKILRS